MPFSRKQGCIGKFKTAANSIRIRNNRGRIQNEQKTNKKNVTLQVRTFSQLKSSCCARDKAGKRVSLSVSGAVTLEAALALSLFIFASVCLLLPMKVMNTERQIQAALEMCGEDLSKYAYLGQALEQNKLFAVAGAGDFAKGFCKYLAAGIGEGYVQAVVENHVETSQLQNVSCRNSEIFTDDEFVDLVMDYEIRLPFPVLGIPALQRTARCRRRAWIGIAGKNYDGEGGEEEDDPIVYVGKGSTRYHLSSSCHYLSNKLTVVSKTKVDAERNQDGRRYRPCAVCGSQSSGNVYIMPSGESYHTDPDCRAIIAYAQAVHLSEAEHLGACSYCGK